MSNKLEFRASELVINERNGVEYLNIRNAGNEALIEEAKAMGVKEFTKTEEVDEEE
jgi:hypothetical protein